MLTTDFILLALLINGDMESSSAADLLACPRTGLLYTHIWACRALSATYMPP